MVVAELPLDVEGNVARGESTVSVHGLPAPVDVEESRLLLLLSSVSISPQAVVSLTEPAALEARLRDTRSILPPD